MSQFRVVHTRFEARLIENPVIYIHLEANELRIDPGESKSGDENIEP